MRCPRRESLIALIVLTAACGGDSGSGGGPDPAAAVERTPATERALRRAYDGAPPVIPHGPFGAACTSCHNKRGMEVPGLGFAPPSPHAHTAPPSAMSRCVQCHVHALTDTVFVDNHFTGLPQDLRKGRRLFDGAPPVIPHQVLLRENCAACHTGPAARDEIRTSHPERVRCTQCHVEQRTTEAFTRAGG